MPEKFVVIVFDENKMRILAVGEKFQLLEVLNSWDLNQIKNIKV